MSRNSCMRLGAGLLSLAVPFMMAGPVAAAPTAPEVSSVELACLALGFDVNTCTFAVREGVYDVVEGDVNADLAEQGVAYTVDVGDQGCEPGRLRLRHQCDRHQSASAGRVHGRW